MSAQPSLLKGMQVMQCGFGTYSSPVSAQMEHHSKLPSAARRIAYAPNGESARGGQNQGRGWRRTAMPQTGWMRNVGGRRGENVPGTVAQSLALMIVTHSSHKCSSAICGCTTVPSCDRQPAQEGMVGTLWFDLKREGKSALLSGA